MDINTKYQRGNSLLHLVAETDNVDALKILIDNGIDVNQKNDFQGTPLGEAANSNAINAMNYLIEHGAEINPKPLTDSKNSCSSNQNTPIHSAAFRSINAVKLLAEKGANINAQDPDGNTPLRNAIWGDSLNIVAYLLDKGADPNISNNEGSTPLHLAVSLGNVEIVQALIKKGANPNSLNKNQQTPLHIASISGFTQVINTLVANGAKLDLKDKASKLPSDYALYYGHTATAEALKKGSNSSHTKQVKPLFSETIGQKEAVVYYLKHSSWAVKTQNHLLILDYYVQGRQPDNLSLMNGWINPLELKDQNITVISSHNHSDHFDPVIWQWEATAKSINYVLGFSSFETASNRMYIDPRVTKEANGIKITPINSTDAGEGFLIEVDGVTIFHPGDHASETRDISENFKSEIEFLAGLKKPIDLMFLPVTGCSFPDIEAVKLGDLYAIGKLNPKTVFPMHGSSTGYYEFADRAVKEYKNLNLEVAENRGDRFLFSGGKTTKIEI